MKPKISIVIPVFNTEKYISKCIESIVNQNLKELEIIIVNDGSEDNSEAICKSYAEKDKRIIFINQLNQGVSVARNNGVKIASGEYVGFVDSDDWIEHDMFEILYNNSVLYDADISMCNVNYIDENEQIILDKNNKPQFRHYNFEIDDNIIFNGDNKMMVCVHHDNNYIWNKIYKKHIFQNVLFPKDKIYEDIFVTHKLIDKANRIVVSPKYNYNYLKHCNSISSTNKIFKIEQLNIVEGYIDRYDYVAIKYPCFEKICRACIFLSLLSCLYRAYIDNCILKHEREFNDIIDKVRLYEIEECGLDIEQEKLLRLSLTGIKKYIIGIKFALNRVY